MSAARIDRNSCLSILLVFMLITIGLPSSDSITSRVFAGGPDTDKVPQQQLGSSVSTVAGRALFSHEWQAGDPRSPGGDGLGPLFNEKSCKACHHQAGLGGGGPVDKNVDLLSLNSFAEQQKNRNPLEFLTPNQFRTEVIRLHPGFLRDGQLQSNIVLHKFSTRGDRYRQIRQHMLGLAGSSITSSKDESDLPTAIPLAGVRDINRAGIEFRHSQRNTPALFGSGLIDAIPDATLRSLARHQSQHFPGITGRVAPVGRGVGRFGWRGQTAHLRDFVLGACANELGLEIGKHHQVLDPERPRYATPGPDLNGRQATALINFVGSLAAPKPVLPSEPHARQLAARGQQIFSKIGCAACHVPSIGRVKDLYSDLLLHDMGSTLADPSPATPATTISSAGYYGGGFNVMTSTPESVTRREWQTPPLWGVADSAPYLHDGRAVNLWEAIAMHAGESRPSRDAFLSMPATDRMALLAFLKTLKAPSLEKGNG